MSISCTRQSKSNQCLFSLCWLSWPSFEQQQVPHRCCVTEGIVPPLCACGCLAYYYGLSGRLPGWWSLSELDTEISSRLWCAEHQGGRAELVWSSASHLTLVNNSNESGLFLGGLFFIRGVRGRRPRLAGFRIWEGRQLKKGVREGDTRAEGEGEKHSVASWLRMFCFLCVPLVLLTLTASRSPSMCEHLTP